MAIAEKEEALQALPAPIKSTYRVKCPTAGGVAPFAASGGEGASIAKMYILRLQGNIPCPLCRLRAEPDEEVRKSFALTAQSKKLPHE